VPFLCTLEVVYNDALYKSTFTLLYFESEQPIPRLNQYTEAAVMIIAAATVIAVVTVAV